MFRITGMTLLLFSASVQAEDYPPVHCAERAHFMRADRFTLPCWFLPLLRSESVRCILP